MPNQQPNQQLNIDQSASAGQKLSPINWRHNRFLKILGPICIIAFLIYISAFLILLYYKVTAPCTNCILPERVSILANIAFLVELFTLAIIVSGSLLYSSILLFRLKKLDGIDKLFSVIILINFLLTGGVYWWQWYGSSMMEFSHPEYIVSIPKPADETANWQTHLNDEYGFEVKYPKDYKFSSSFLSIQAQNDLNIFIDKKDVNEELLSLSDYINYYYKTNYYENPDSGAYLDPDYKEIINTGHFERIISKNENIEIWREKLQAALGGFESVAYLMDNNNKNTIIIFSWSISGNDEKIAEEMLVQFDRILSTFKFTK